MFRTGVRTTFTPLEVPSFTFRSSAMNDGLLVGRPSYARSALRTPKKTGGEFKPRVGVTVAHLHLYEGKGLTGVLTA